jgi:hypothetical protein
VSQQIKPDMLCRIVNTNTEAKNALVRTIFLDPMDGEWMCEALQHVPCVQSGYVGLLRLSVQRVANPGEHISIPPGNLQPLYDGDAEDEMVSRMRKRTEEISHS